MFNLYWLVLFICLVIIILYSLRLVTTTQLMEPFEQPYSSINDDINIGNPISWSHRINQWGEISRSPHPHHKYPIIYQGFGIPLLHEDHPTAPVDESMFYYSDLICHPKCCQYSQHACSHGCVCSDIDDDHVVLQNVAISPRS